MQWRICNLSLNQEGDSASSPEVTCLFGRWIISAVSKEGHKGTDFRVPNENRLSLNLMAGNSKYL
jgi:hypothetical protein